MLCIVVLSIALHAEERPTMREPAALSAPSDLHSTNAMRLTTGNLSVEAIQHSPVGAAPDPAFHPPLPSVEDLTRLRHAGLDGYEDYIAWGMVEPREGEFDFAHHEKVCDLLTSAGLAYIPYIWCHVPPTWLRHDPRATLMQCNAHGEACNMLSIFDPRSLGWYEHFYRALHDRFRGNIAETYACILGPYGEGNYPLPYVDWVLSLGHCHEGFWCGDAYALPDFRKAMMRQYATIHALNTAWNTKLTSFDEIRFPDDVTSTTITPMQLRPIQDRRRWLDFIHWYHNALIDFAGKSADLVVRVFGRERVAVKPGGNAGWMNPLSWGTYCPGFAKMAGKRGIAAQSADSRGAYWADRWCSTAYAYYGVRYRTEAAGELDRPSFIRRTFSDASCGASRLFTYEIDKHLTDSVQWLRFFNGERSKTDIALLAPTTSYYLNADVHPAIETGNRLRDWFDYDVLDELLVHDGALLSSDQISSRPGARRYKVLVAIGCDVVEKDVLKRISDWTFSGGILVWASRKQVQDVEGGTDYPMNSADRSARTPFGGGWILRTGGAAADIADAVATAVDLPRDGSARGLLDGKQDGVWCSEFNDHLLLLNLNQKPVTKSVRWRGTTTEVTLPAGEINVLPEK